MMVCSLNLKEFSRSGNGHLGAVQLCFQLGLWQTACRDLRPAGMSLNFVGLRSIVLQGWSLPPKVVTKIAESFAILTFGSSFMHGRFDNIFLYIFLSCDNDIFLTATRGLERSKMSEATISSHMSSTRWSERIVNSKPDFMSLHIISFWKWVWPISTIISQS